MANYIKTEEGYISLDTKLLESRIVTMEGEITEALCSEKRKELIYLNSIDKKSPIYLYISGPGGDAAACLGFMDTMDFIEAPIYTYALGQVCSADSLIFAHGTKRFIFPNSQVMIHQGISGSTGKISDNVNNINHFKRINNLIVAILMKDCNKLNHDELCIIRDAISNQNDNLEYQENNIPKELYERMVIFKKTIDLDTWLVGKEAINFGVADEIVKIQNKNKK